MILVIITAGIQVQGQSTVAIAPDTSSRAATPDSLRIKADSLNIKPVGEENNFGLEDVVDCRSLDSLIFDIETQKVYMYQQAEIDYQTTNLKADYVEIDFSKSLAYARGRNDSTGKLV